MAEGLVYDFFDKETHVTSKLPGAGRYYISIDYGTMNPFSAGLWCVHQGIAYRIKEWYYNGREKHRQLTDEEYYEKLVEFAGDLDIQKVVIDPSAASFITLIRRKGRFKVQKANNDVVAGINMTAQMLKGGRVRIGADCVDAIREFGLYAWDDKSKDKDRVIKENDHAMDDIRYFCMTIMAREANAEYKSLWVLR